MAVGQTQAFSWPFIYEKLQGQAVRAKGLALVAAKTARSKATEARSDAQKVFAERVFHVTAAASMAGGIVLGTAGAVAGLVAGGAVGAAAGVIPSLFTLGLSIPVGAAVGGTAGASLGVVGGSTAGTIGGAATGYGLYVNRGRFAFALKLLEERAAKCAECAKANVIVPVTTRASQGATKVAAKASQLKGGAMIAAGHAKSKAAAVGSQAKAAAAEPWVQVTAAASSGGAILVGVGGGAVGVSVGGFLGATLGVIPALFTFGLSIPAGAFIGSGAGLCVGTTCGASVGALSGGAAGYGAYAKREEIRVGASMATLKIAQCKELVQRKAEDSAEFVRERAADSAHFVQQKIRATTGGTA